MQPKNTLNARERKILALIVQNYVETGQPVSSGLIARKSTLNISPATVRQIMAGLEEKGYIHQPHTSAGRVPETLGYRVYVDSLMRRSRLSNTDRDQLQESISEGQSALEDSLREVSQIIAHLSQQLGIIVSPSLDNAIFQRLEMISLSSERLMIILSIASGLVKTLTIEINSMIPREHLETVSSLLNERLQGMQLSAIRRHFGDIVRDIQSEKTGLVKLVRQRADRLFNFDQDLQVHFMGTQYMVRNPDFSNTETVSSVVELLESGRIVLHLQNDTADDRNIENPVNIQIGEEIQNQKMQECSIISTTYNIGNITGIIGLLGPKRINYARMISLVDYAARLISNRHRAH